MLSGLKNGIRRRIRGLQRSAQYVLLLPHHRDHASLAVFRTAEVWDGTRTLKELARQSVVSRSQFMKLHDDGLVILWRSQVPRDLPIVDRPGSIILSPHP